MFHDDSYECYKIDDTLRIEIIHLDDGTLVELQYDTIYYRPICKVHSPRKIDNLADALDLIGDYLQDRWLDLQIKAREDVNLDITRCIAVHDFMHGRSEHEFHA